MDYQNFKAYFSGNKTKQDLEELKFYITLIGVDAAAYEVWCHASFALMMQEDPSGYMGDTKIWSYSIEFSDAYFEFNTFRPVDDRLYTAYWYRMEHSTYVNGDAEFIDYTHQIKTNFCKHFKSFLSDYVRIKN